MATSDEMSGTYHEYKGKIKQRFGEFSDDEFDRASGSLEQMIGFLQQKTGEARRSIEEFLHGLSGNAGKAAEQAQHYAHQAADSMRQGYDQMSSNMQEGYESMQSTVRQRPMESMAVALGAGVLVGAVLGLMISTRSR